MVFGGGIILKLLFDSMISTVTLIIIFTFLLTRIRLFKKLLAKKNINLKDSILLSLIFASIGIIGTYSGTRLGGAIVNGRAIGVFVGGLLGGPLVGLLSGSIAGLHRYLYDIGGFTSIACSLATIVEGCMAGFLKSYYDKSEIKGIFAFIAGVFGESLQMLMIVLLSQPREKAVELVGYIGFPMIVSNAFGIVVFISIVESIYKEQEKEAAYQAQLALKIANETQAYFRKGYNEKTALETAKIIKKHTDIDGVAFTDEEKILAHIGLGEDHHKPGNPILTLVTREVLKEARYMVSNDKESIQCSHEDCPLSSAIIVPLKERERVIGSLKLYKKKENAITAVELELALGLAQLFSTQIELSKLDEQKELLKEAELRALQSQINPHFLFNAINTIVSFIRIKPEEARELLMELGNYFRSNLTTSCQDIELSKEIENVNSYLTIEKARFGDKLEVIYDIDEDVDCRLPALMIQPLVENAIKHGILKKLEGGFVKISAKEIPGASLIRVEDNGVGMSKDKLEGLLSDQAPKTSIGLRNVDRRLKNKYGSQNGLRIESQEDQGTKVFIVIPKKEMV